MSFETLVESCTFLRPWCPFRLEHTVLNPQFGWHACIRSSCGSEMHRVPVMVYGRAFAVHTAQVFNDDLQSSSPWRPCPNPTDHPNILVWSQQGLLVHCPVLNRCGVGTSPVSKGHYWDYLSSLLFFSVFLIRNWSYYFRPELPPFA